MYLLRTLRYLLPLRWEGDARRAAAAAVPRRLNGRPAVRALRPGPGLAAGQAAISADTPPQKKHPLTQTNPNGN